MDQNEIADIIKLGLNRQGFTVTKVVIYSVRSRLRLYQARTSLRRNQAGVFVNEDLTKIREKLKETWLEFSSRENKLQRTGPSWAEYISRRRQREM